MKPAPYRPTRLGRPTRFGRPMPLWQDIAAAALFALLAVELLAAAAMLAP